MPIPNWINTEDWDVLRLGGVRIPGIAKVTGALGSGLDIKKPKGGKRATIKDDGDPPGELDVELDMSHEDVVHFAEVLPILRAVTKNGARDPLKLEHPMAYLASIHNVTVGDIHLEHPEQGGRMKVTLKLIEWAPAPVAVAPSKPAPVDNQEDIVEYGRYRDDGVAGSGAPPRPQPMTPVVQIRKPSASAGKNI
jgi:hypothetical protein